MEGDTAVTQQLPHTPELRAEPGRSDACTHIHTHFQIKTHKSISDFRTGFFLGGVGGENYVCMTYKFVAPILATSHFSVSVISFT